VERGKKKERGREGGEGGGREDLVSPGIPVWPPPPFPECLTLAGSPWILRNVLRVW